MNDTKWNIGLTLWHLFLCFVVGVWWAGWGVGSVILYWTLVLIVTFASRFISRIVRYNESD